MDTVLFFGFMFAIWYRYEFGLNVLSYPKHILDQAGSGFKLMTENLTLSNIREMLDSLFKRALIVALIYLVYYMMSSVMMKVDLTNEGQYRSLLKIWTNIAAVMFQLSLCIFYPAVMCLGLYFIGRMLNTYTKSNGLVSKIDSEKVMELKMQNNMIKISELRKQQAHKLFKEEVSVH